MSRKPIICLLAALALMMACKPKTPSQFIQPDDMEEILVDFYMARAMAQRQADQAYTQALYEEAVFSKHDVTRAEFDSSLVYYYTRADRFNAVLQRVADRLEERALVLGATEGEIGKYAMLNANGDTANIWAERSNMAMMPVPVYNRWDFTIEADSTFRKGDSFLLQFVTNYMYQSGNKTGIAYMAVDYQDTTIARNLRFSVSGLSQLRFPAQPKVIKRIRGYFYLDDGHEQTTTTRLLFMSNVQLIRFHDPKYEENQKDSLPQDSLARPVGTDSLCRGDSLRGRQPMLSLDGGAADDRVAPRQVEPQIR